MTGNRSGGRPNPSGKNAPPVPTRRSARQQRIANRQNRALDRARTQPRSEGLSPLLLTTGAAVVVILILAGLFVLSQSTKPKVFLGSPQPPAAIHSTPTGLPTSGTGGMTLGTTGAKVKIDIWEDFQCPNCLIFTNDVEPTLVDKYVKTGQATIRYHDFLVIDRPGGTESLDAANAARCAGDQGKFWLMHDWLFANQGATENSGAFTKDRLKTMAQLAGLDMSKFQPCLDGGTHNAAVNGDTPPAGATGTPTVQVNNATVADFSLSGVEAAVDKALGIASPSPSASASPSPAATPTATPAPTASPTPVASAS